MKKILLTAVSGVLFVAGCSADETDFKETAEKTIEREMKNQADTEVEAECEDPSSTDVGTVFTCTATADDGTVFNFSAEITKEDQVTVTPA